MRKVIALDCDGVMLNYLDTYKKLYDEMFNTDVKVVNPRSFAPNMHFGISWTERQEDKLAFQVFFDENGWKNMKALPGAVEATKHMKELGFDIVVVTSIPKNKDLDRMINLEKAGFPINDLIACGAHSSTIPGSNLKEPYLKKIMPQYFVDDLLSNFHNVSDIMKCVLIDWSCENNDDWNSNKKEQIVEVFDTHEYLLDFSLKHLMQPHGEKKKKFS